MLYVTHVNHDQRDTHVHMRTEVCIAAPKYALPLRNISCHSEICVATPKYILPLRNISCHSEIYLATPKYILPLRNMCCHSEICIVTRGGFFLSGGGSVYNSFKVSNMKRRGAWNQKLWGVM